MTRIAEEPRPFAPPAAWFNLVGLFLPLLTSMASSIVPQYLSPGAPWLDTWSIAQGVALFVAALLTRLLSPSPRWREAAFYCLCGFLSCLIPLFAVAILCTANPNSRMHRDFKIPRRPRP